MGGAHSRGWMLWWTSVLVRGWTNGEECRGDLTVVVRWSSWCSWFWCGGGIAVAPLSVTVRLALRRVPYRKRVVYVVMDVVMLGDGGDEERAIIATPSRPESGVR